MNVKEQAKQAGWGNIVSMPHISALERFAALVRAEALEEAAGVCEQYAKHKLEEEMPIAYVYGSRECAAAIRALKEKK